MPASLHELQSVTLTGISVPRHFFATSANLAYTSELLGASFNELAAELSKLTRRRWRTLWLRGAGRGVLSVVYLKNSLPGCRDLSRMLGEDFTSPLRLTMLGLYCLDRAVRHAARGNQERSYYFFANAKNAQSVLLNILIQRERAAKAKGDKLNRAIGELLRENPDFSWREVLVALGKDAGFDVDDTGDDGTIEWENYVAPISGLKDRVSRARKKLRSR